MSDTVQTKFKVITDSLARLLSKKNEAYGDSFAVSDQMLKLLYPEGVTPGDYKDLLAITRILDKLKRIATKKDAFGESPWQDIAGYAILSLVDNNVEYADSSDVSCRPGTSREEMKDVFYETIGDNPYLPKKYKEKLETIYGLNFDKVVCDDFRLSGERKMYGASVAELNLKRQYRENKKLSTRIDKKIIAENIRRSTNATSHKAKAKKYQTKRSHKSHR